MWKCQILKVPNFSFCGGREPLKTNDFIFLEPWYSLLEFKSRIVCQYLTNWTRWNKRDTVWSSVNPLFKGRFCNRRRPCCLSSLVMGRRRNLRAFAGICEFHMTYFKRFESKWKYSSLLKEVSLAHFPRFCWQYFSLSNAFSIHLARKTYFLLCSGFWNIFLTFLLLFCLQN